MSETVIIALITFAAGAIGAIFGAISSIKSARIAQTSQMHQAIVAQFMQSRVATFSLIFEQWSKFVYAEYDPAVVPQLIAAIEKSSMLATPSTTAILMDFQKELMVYVKSSPHTPAQLTKLGEAVMNLRVALQFDLLRYYEPHIAKLPESAKLPNVIGLPITEKTEPPHKARKSKQ